MKSFLWRHKSLVIIWVVVFGIAGYSAYILTKSSDNENPYVLSNSADKPAETKTPDTPKQPTQATIGQAATDGNVEFTVHGIKCGETTIGSNAYAHDQAEGEFCRLSLKVKNTAAQTISLPAKRQKLVDSTGKEYELDTQATQYTQSDLSSGDWFTDITASKTRTGDLAFDITAGASIKKAMLYGSEDTPGVEVSL